MVPTRSSSAPVYIGSGYTLARLEAMAQTLVPAFSYAPLIPGPIEGCVCARARSDGQC